MTAEHREQSTSVPAYEEAQASLPEMERIRRIIPLLMGTLARMPSPEGEGQPVPPALSLSKLKKLLGLPKLRAAVSSQEAWRNVISVPEGWEVREMDPPLPDVPAGVIILENEKEDSYILSHVGPTETEPERTIIGFAGKESSNGGMLHLAIGQDGTYKLSLMYGKTPLSEEEIIKGEFADGKLISRMFGAEI